MDVGEIIYKKSEFIETVSKMSFVNYLFLKIRIKNTIFV
jgi:hypothetical protein